MFQWDHGEGWRDQEAPLTERDRAPGSESAWRPTVNQETIQLFPNNTTGCTRPTLKGQPFSPGEQVLDASKRHAEQAGVTADDIDSAVDEAMEHIRPRPDARRS